MNVSSIKRTIQLQKLTLSSIIGGAFTLKKIRKRICQKLCIILSLVLMVLSFSISKVAAYGEDLLIYDFVYYNIKNVRSGQYLDVCNANTSDGTNVIQWKYTGNDNQKWKVVYLGGGLYKIVSALDTTKALTVGSSSGGNGINIYISTFTNSVTQRFALERKSDSTHKVLTNASNYICAMTVQNASCNQGANVFQYTYNGTHNDEWLFEISNDAYYSSLGIKYARDNYNNHLNTYGDMSDLGGDCANFVSQCLAFGGKKYSGNWYIYKKNNNNLIPQNVNELDDSWELSDPSPWISAKYFGQYWSNLVSYNTFSPQQIINNHSSTNTVYGRGDVVQILKWSFLQGYRGYHTMIVTDVEDFNDKGTFKLTYHSSNTKDKSLSSICENYDNSNYRIRFYKIV